MALQHLRSSTADKRPDPTAMADGQFAINTESNSPGVFFKDSAGGLVKVGPVHIGTTAPNATPAGESGNSAGEFWLDTTGGAAELKLYDGSGWTTVGLPIAGGALTGDVTLNARSDLRFADSDSSNWVAFQAPATIASNVTWTLPSADASVSGYALVSDGAGTLSWAETGGGAILSDDTTTNSTYYPVFATTTSGDFDTAKVSAGKLTYNPSTGALSATALSGTLAGSNVSGNISGNAANITAYTINQSVGTSSNVQHNSLGIGTSASGSAGDIRATGNITAYYSDDRLKTKLGNIENALEKICSLNGFYYEANKVAQELGYACKREVGVSAQEVEKVLPEIVTSAPVDEMYKTIYYERLTPLLIEAIKELHSEIASLRIQVNGVT